MKTILIVDDEPAARYGLRRALEAKYRIAEADSAEAAREALPREQPDPGNRWPHWSRRGPARLHLADDDEGRSAQHRERKHKAHANRVRRTGSALVQAG